MKWGLVSFVVFALGATVGWLGFLKYNQNRAQTFSVPHESLMDDLQWPLEELLRAKDLRYQAYRKLRRKFYSNPHEIASQRHPMDSKRAQAYVENWIAYGHSKLREASQRKTFWRGYGLIPLSGRLIPIQIEMVPAQTRKKI